MEDNNEKFNQLLYKLNDLLNRQDSFSKEINELREDIMKLKTSPVRQTSKDVTEKTIVLNEADIVSPISNINLPPIPLIPQEKILSDQPVASVPPVSTIPKINRHEKYIGEISLTK
jgi:hypothetical protein